MWKILDNGQKSLWDRTEKAYTNLTDPNIKISKISTGLHGKVTTKI